MLPSIIVISIISLFAIAGCVAVLRKKRGWIGFSATLFILGTSAWQICLIISGNIIDNDLIHRITFTVTSWVAIATLILSQTFPERKIGKNVKTFDIALLVVYGLQNIIMFFSSFIIKGYVLETLTVQFGPLGGFFLGSLAMIVVIAILNFTLRYVKEKKERFYFKYIFFAFGLAAGTGIITNLLLPISGNTSLSLLGSLVATIPQVALAYTLGFGSLSGLGYIVGEIVRIIVRSVLYFALFYLTIYIHQQYSNSLFTSDAYIRGGIIALGVSVLMGFLEGSLKTYIEKRFFYKKLNPLAIKDEFTLLLKDKLDMNECLDTIVKYISKTFQTDIVNIVLIDDRGNFEEHFSSVKSTKLEEIEEGLVKKTGRVFEFTVSSSKHGAIVLGRKSTQEPYTLQEIQLLKDLAQMSATAVSRSYLYEEVERFNERLKRDIAKATKELRVKVEELEAARTKERDMIDIMGHELRTPATVVKLNIGLLSLLKKKLNTEDSKRFLTYENRIRDSIDNEIRIINTLLTTAKLEGNQLELTRVPVDVINAIELALQGHKQEAAQKGISLTFFRPEKAKAFPKAYADKGRFQEIVDNLVSNAVKYTFVGGVSIEVTIVGKMIQISVIDTGEGIEKDVIPNLGKKFFRTHPYISDKEGRERLSLVRPGGIGIGLYVVFGLVRAFGGEIKVESQKGKGSIFTFTIPIAPDNIQDIDPLNGNLFERMRPRK